jgi:hypothetical protein
LYKIQLLSEYFSCFAWFSTLVRPNLMIHSTARTHLRHSSLTINLCCGPAYHLPKFGHRVFLPQDQPTTQKKNSRCMSIAQFHLHISYHKEYSTHLFIQHDWENNGCQLPAFCQQTDHRLTKATLMWATMQEECKIK